MNTNPRAAPQESILAEIDGQCATERLILVWCYSPRTGSRLELRQQSWGEGIGWFTQQSIPLEPEQAAELRYALSGGASPSECRHRSAELTDDAMATSERPLRVVRAEPA